MRESREEMRVLADGEWELTPQELATIFAFMGWKYATPVLGYGLPNPDQIKALFRDLVREIRDDGREDVIAVRGRFMAVRTGMTPGSIDMYLNVGYVWDDEMLSDDELQMLAEMYDGDDQEDNEND
jgi:hypothetical protein